MSSGNPTETSRDPDLTGAEAAMHRAAQETRVDERNISPNPLLQNTLKRHPAG